MKRFFGFFALVGVLLSASAFIASETLKYNVDTEKSTVNWKGYKVAGSHEGTLNLKSGGLEYTDGLLSGGTFEIDMTSMAVTDLKGGSAKKLLGHLKSDDFFGVNNFPTTTFNITSVFPQGPDRYKVIGDLTVKEVTKSIKFIATTTEKDGIITANAEITVDRSDYDVRYGSGTFFDNLGDKAIYDNFDLNVSLVVNK
ncbi:MAG: YceI family protein [Bacteroidota bacterium]